MYSPETAIVSDIPIEWELTMTKLLHIKASPRGSESQSSQLAEAYIDQLKADDVSLEVDTIALWQADLPEFDGDKSAAKMSLFGIGEMTGQLQSEWDQIVAITNRFLAADLYVFSIPMWNGGIPYKLKQYIDVITQPGLLFGFDPEAGYNGLLSGKKARVFYTSGVFAPGSPEKYGQDYQSNYMSWWLKFVGIEEAEEIRFQPSLLTADPVADQKAALDRAKQAAL